MNACRVGNDDEFPPIPVGTWFAVPFEDLLVPGIVLNSVPGRVFCSVMHPAIANGVAFDQRPTATDESRYMVDDDALLDGSWPIFERDADIKPEPIPRFKWSSKDGKPTFAIYSSETFFFVDNVPLNPDDQAEWDRAYWFINPAIPFFLESVIRTFRLPVAHSAPAVESEDVKSARYVVARLRKCVSDLERPIPFDFNADFKRMRDAKAARDALSAEGIDATLFNHWPRGASVTAQKTLVPKYPDVAREIDWFKSFVEEFAGVYDGFGAEAL